MAGKLRFEFVLSIVLKKYLWNIKQKVNKKGLSDRKYYYKYISFQDFMKTRSISTDFGLRYAYLDSISIVRDKRETVT